MRRLRLGAALVVAALGAAAVPVAAQRPAERASAAWELDTLRSGFCIHFLVEPAAAGKGKFRGVLQSPARATDSLHPSLRRLIEGSPEFAAWIPQRFCVYQFSAIRAGGRELRDTKHGRSQVVAVWSTNTRPDAPGSALLLVNNSRLSNSVKGVGLGVDVLKTEFGKVPESTDDRYQIRYSGTTLTWDGHASGDSTAAPNASHQWVAPGRNGRVVDVRMQLDPAGARLMVGALRVEGKGELARTLVASPIRYVGPIVWGGGGSMSFASR